MIVNRPEFGLGTLPRAPGEFIGEVWDTGTVPQKLAILHPGDCVKMLISSVLRIIRTVIRQWLNYRKITSILLFFCSRTWLYWEFKPSGPQQFIHLTFAVIISKSNYAQN